LVLGSRAARELFVEIDDTLHPQRIRGRADGLRLQISIHVSQRVHSFHRGSGGRSLARSFVPLVMRPIGERTLVLLLDRYEWGGWGLRYLRRNDCGERAAKREAHCGGRQERVR
jgi:hypothetical protein